MIISKSKINFAHLYCALGYSKELNAALSSNCELRTDSKGKSPLNYAIKRNSIKCVDEIILYLENLKINDLIKFTIYCHSIRKDFNEIFQMPSTHLPAFLNSIFITCEEGLPNIALPKLELPIMIYDMTTRIYANNFVEEIDSVDEKLVEFKTCVIELPVIKGSIDSISMLKALNETKNDKIFRTPLIKMIIDDK